ncbi:ATP-binding protein [Conexibacter sp. DBS9H8]|uniref:ATP-binding protein n=1 Tax=Conexibacter sp. DBS9H8 TaxID=2937801 RepID=UPI00200EE35D|nr:ATP-binding protein [Conexibacter sp. DBS9H8]
MIHQPVTVRLDLESLPENVALVRAALSGIADAVGLGDELTSDLKTALSEACNNVALHAYEGGSGPLVTEIAVTAHGVSVSVRDEGSGLRRISGGEDRMGLGLAVISALASQSEFRRPEEGGTEVRMFFRRAATDQPGGVDGALTAHQHARAAAPATVARASDEVLISLTPVAVARYVLGRTVQAIAAASHFSITTLSDLRTANDAIARYLEDAADGIVNVAIASTAHRLELIAAPLPANDPKSAEKVLAGVVAGFRTDRERLCVELRDRAAQPPAPGG